MHLPTDVLRNKKRNKTGLIRRAFTPTVLRLVEVSPIFLYGSTITEISIQSACRSHVIENIPFLDKSVVERLLERTRDIDTHVRCCAWRRLADLNFWKHTSSPQLLTLFLQGLKDKYEHWY